MIKVSSLSEKAAPEPKGQHQLAAGRLALSFGAVPPAPTLGSRASHRQRVQIQTMTLWLTNPISTAPA
jgi:hypothetical protein